MAERARKGDITEKGRQEMQELLQANTARNRVLKGHFPLSMEGNGSEQ